MNSVIIIKSAVSVPIFPHPQPPLLFFKRAHLNQFLSHPPSQILSQNEKMLSWLSSQLIHHPYSWQGPAITRGPPKSVWDPWLCSMAAHLRLLWSLSFPAYKGMFTRGCSGLFEVHSWVPRWEEMCLNCSGHYRKSGHPESTTGNGGSCRSAVWARHEERVDLLIRSV